MAKFLFVYCFSLILVFVASSLVQFGMFQMRDGFEDDFGMQNAVQQCPVSYVFCLQELACIPDEPEFLETEESEDSCEDEDKDKYSFLGPVACPPGKIFCLKSFRCVNEDGKCDEREKYRGPSVCPPGTVFCTQAMDCIQDPEYGISEVACEDEDKQKPQKVVRPERKPSTKKYTDSSAEKMKGSTDKTVSIKPTDKPPGFMFKQTKEQPRDTSMHMRKMSTGKPSMKKYTDSSTEKMKGSTDKTVSVKPTDKPSGFMFKRTKEQPRDTSMHTRKMSTGKPSTKKYTDSSAEKMKGSTDKTVSVKPTDKPPGFTFKRTKEQPRDTSMHTIKMSTGKPETKPTFPPGLAKNMTKTVKIVKKKTGEFRRFMSNTIKLFVKGLQKLFG